MSDFFSAAAGPLNVSRRRLIVGGIASGLIAPGLALGQTLISPPPQTLPPADGTPPANPLATPDESASFNAGTDPAMHVTIDVMINGKGPFQFVVDTGAERSVLADTVVAELGLIPNGRVQVDGIIRRVPADLVSVAEIRYGPFTRTDLRLPVLPRKYLLADGFLGLDAINGTRVTLDFHRKQLRIDQPKSKFLPPEPGTEIVIVKAAGNSGRLRATDCYIDGVKAAAFIDTGAEISLGNPALENALRKRNGALNNLGPATLTGVTGGELIGHIIPIEKVTLKDLAFTQGDLVIADVPDFDDWDLTTQPALLLGMDYLRQFASVSIDYRKHEIRFDLSSLQEDHPGLQKTPPRQAGLPSGTDAHLTV